MKLRIINLLKKKKIKKNRWVYNKKGNELEIRFRLLGPV